MTIEQQREAVKKAYLGDRWLAKVAKMSDKEISVIYLRLKDQGIIK